MSTVILKTAEETDFSYVYGLCDTTMRKYVEIDFGDCFDEIARPTIEKLIARRLFFKVYRNGGLVGALAYERHETHIQLEELYIEPAWQQQGIGRLVMARITEEAISTSLPIRLHVLASNPANRFYEKLGFILTRSTAQVNYMEQGQHLEAVPAA